MAKHKDTSEIAETGATETEVKAPKPKKVKPLIPCQCGLIPNPDGKGWIEGQCPGTTKSKFAQGHDARLKGHLLALHRAEGNQTYQGKAPVDVLLENKWIENAEQANARPRPIRAKKAPAEKRQVKIGRFKFDVTSIDGDKVTYKTPSGEEKETTADKLIPIEDAA